MGKILVPPEVVSRALSTAVARNSGAIQDGKLDAHGADSRLGLSYHILGGIGEPAVAIRIGAEWDADIGTYKTKADVAKDYEVRARSRHWYDLIIRHDDFDDRKYVLVTMDNFPMCPLSPPVKKCDESDGAFRLRMNVYRGSMRTFESKMRHYLDHGIECEVHGWIMGAEGKQSKWLKNYGNREWAYFVPKEALIDEYP